MFFEDYCWRTVTGVYSRDTKLGNYPIFGNDTNEIPVEVLLYLIR